MSESEPATSRTTILRALDHRIRRCVVRYMSGRPDAVDVDSLATAIQGESVAAGDPIQGSVERLRIALHHVHLPMLAEARLIEYDAPTRRVATASDGPPDRIVERLLRDVGSLSVELRRRGGGRYGEPNTGVGSDADGSV